MKQNFHQDTEHDGGLKGEKMIKGIRLFEDLHALAHRWVQYASESYPISFEEFLKDKEPSRYQRLYNIFCFVERQIDQEVKKTKGG